MDGAGKFTHSTGRVHKGQFKKNFFL